MITRPIKINENILEIPDNFHKNTWKFYYRQYTNALDYMLYLANKNYQINSQFMPFMFLFRHTVELMLKTNLSEKSLEIANIHNLFILSQGLNQYLPPDFIAQIEILDCRRQGDCFRYLKDTAGNSFFNGEEVKALPALNYFINLSTANGLFFIPFKNRLVPNHRIDWNFTFHTNECRYLGVLRTQYDYTISVLLSGIIEGEFFIKDIYLPLLFLLRHALELGLKDNLLLLQNELTTNDLLTTRRHFVAELFDISHNIINSAISNIPATETRLKDEIIIHQNYLISLINLINELDYRSLAFRFPDNQNFVPPSDIIYQIYELYLKADSYLTFIIDFYRQGNYSGI